MRKLFIHTSLFRFLSPIFTGVVAYLLILLINNNIGQLQEQFLGQELYVSITLSYIVHEFSRFLLWLFKYIPFQTGSVFKLILHCVLAIILSVVLITLLIELYYQQVAGFSPSIKEIITFNSVYCCIPVSYVLLHISHQYLYKINTQKLDYEILIKQNIEEDFKQFKREINPELLFESFEMLLILIDENIDKVDEFIDHLSTIYRYILSSRKNQLVSFNEEKEVLKEFVKLYNHLPYRNVIISVKENANFLIVPGTLLFVIEQIIKTTIVSSKVSLDIEIFFYETNFTISYATEDKINNEFSIKKIEEIARVYSVYNVHQLELKEIKDRRVISIPKLEIKD
ncbi:histidine kinase [Polaribacter gochangensis]|uniref:histidine kinase n=1 Tax=Polaribacter gochangensis TaxID=3252903 RepID=UPI003904E018